MKVVKEMLGYPGSGKSFTLNKMQNSNKKICTLEYIIFNDFLKRNILSNCYLFYIKIVLKSNSINYIKTKVLNPYKGFFDKIIYNDLNIELKNQKISFFKKNKNLVNIFYSLVEDTFHSQQEKKKIIKNFETYCSSYNYYKKNFFSNKSVISDEGFYQKLFLNYNSKKKNKVINKIKLYLKFIPQNIEIINIPTSIEKSIYQCERRAKYFSYKKNYKFLNKFFPKINKIIENYCIKNKIKYYKISLNKLRNK